MSNAKNQDKSGYPQVITCLPEADVPFENSKGWILQADNNQLVFFEFQPDVNLPEHSHSYAQWGIVIDGQMELSINGKPRTCKKGDEYLIPAGAKHSVKFPRKTRVMDLFSEKQRYRLKTL